MKTVLTAVAGLFVAMSQQSIAADKFKLPNSDTCPKLDTKQNITDIWYVAAGERKVYFTKLPGREKTKQYIIQGDLVLVNAQHQNYLCAHYFKKGKVIVSGWLDSAELEHYHVESFGSADVAESQARIPRVRAALTDMANKLPVVTSWQGTYVDKYTNSIDLYKKGSTWRVNLKGIQGTIGSGYEEDDTSELSVKGAIAVYKEETATQAVCDVVIIGFNNAVLGTSGSSCMGSGANHEYPQFNGVYWKQK